MSLDIGTLAGYLDLDTSAFDRKLRDTGDKGRKSGKDFGDSFGDETERSMSSRLGDAAKRILGWFGGQMSTAGKPIALTVGTAFSAQFVGSIVSGLASGVGKVAHGAGALAAVLPAAAVAGVLAMSTLKMAVAGVGDALSAGLAGDTEKFEEALQGLSPAAREVAREVVGFKDRIDDLKSRVQDNFFAPLVGQLRPLADIYLRQANLAMGDLSRTFGQTANGIAAFLRTPTAFRAIWATLDNGRQAVTNLALGAGNLVQAFLPLFSVGSSFLPALTDGFGGLTNRVAVFMQQAERTGELAAFIGGGLAKLRELWQTVQQVGRIFQDLVGIGRKVFGGIGLEAGGLLDKVEGVTDGVNRFLETAQGAGVVGTVLGVVGTVVNNLMGTLQRVAGIIGRVFAPHMPAILEFVDAFFRLKTAVLDVGLDALEPILMAIGNVVGNVVLPVLTGLAEWLAANQPVLQGIGIAIVTLLVPSFVAWAISAGAAAIATILAAAPLILLGAAIAGLAALVIIHFDTIKRWISNVFNWVRDNWPLLLAILTGPFGLAVLFIVRNWQTIKDAATAAKDWIGDRISDIVGFVTGLPGRISRAASGMWDGIKNAFKAAINGIISLWNGLSFPSVTVGGQDPLGSFGPSLPRVTIGGWDLPNIPTLHTGSRGPLRGGPGTELLAILQGGEEVLSRSDPRNVRNAAPGAAGGGLDRLIVELRVVPESLLEVIRHGVRTEGGGDVQVALGQGGV